MFTDGAWSQLAEQLTPARNLYARARLDGVTLVFGGQTADGTFLDDVWVLPDTSPDAAAVEPAGAGPPARAGAELIRDGRGRRVLLFGGRDADGSFADTWALTHPV